MAGVAVGCLAGGLSYLWAHSSSSSSPSSANARSPLRPANLRTIASAATPTVPTVLPEQRQLVDTADDGLAQRDPSTKSAGIGSCFEDAIADAVESVMGSVVNLRMEEDHAGYFGARVLVSLGSGFVIGDEGTVLTNAHVVSGFVDGRARLTVTLSDGRQHSAIVYSTDPVTDLAVVKLTDLTEPLPAARLGSSKKMRPGDWVVALGSPLGFQNSVAAGIISATSRFSDEVGQPRNNLEFYQTDISINEGNSGGPLINLRGEVIGINTVRADANGLSFAMRIDTAMSIIRQLSEEGRVVRPFLGLKLITLTASLLNNLGPDDRGRVPGHTGVLITRIFDGSPAAQGGLRIGDVILRINGAPVATSSEVLNAFGNRVGEQFRVLVRRREAGGEVVDQLCTVSPTELDIYAHQKEAQFLFQ